MSWNSLKDRQALSYRQGVTLKLLIIRLDLKLTADVGVGTHRRDPKEYPPLPPDRITITPWVGAPHKHTAGRVYSDALHAANGSSPVLL